MFSFSVGFVFLGLHHVPFVGNVSLCVWCLEFVHMMIALCVALSFLCVLTYLEVCFCGAWLGGACLVVCIEKYP